ncbi:hypothetical protein NicSoilB4_00650 [Arthrobacter sp. NicSoilB4]|uniref:DUF6226 family protein n=1 Tax=Arthrobacter sp. NicSoilB4 TaxID=2830997 RepID=UPI001CC42471|nr:DUF6226 family protein [Arthrobacter sp. NicSoilB4]BCW65302.1 hypothetical protein NicSoilB4_00650 [Arthrobacter sp. NicSoilB4]
MGPTEDLFEGMPGRLPESMARGRALYRSTEGPTAAVRHVGGYAPFIEFCERNGVHAGELASDPEGLIWFLRWHGAQLAHEGALSAAAAVFAGNTIAGLRPDARWYAYEGAPPTVGNRERQFEVDRLLDGLVSADDESIQELVSMLAVWAQEELDEAPAAQPIPVAPSAGQPRYVRPHLPQMTYFSPEGRPIPYGRQWGDDGPDPDSYSVDSHPERFAGLHGVARALIDHLRDVYDVDVDDDPVHAGEMLLDVKDVLESVKVTPRRSGAAPLTFVLTGYPGVAVHAGVLHDFPFPVCGCDACDETVETTADRLEFLVLSVAAGGYRERYPVGRKRWSEYTLNAFDGSGSESGQSEPAPAAGARLRVAETRLREVAAGWRPWPLRGR